MDGLNYQLAFVHNLHLPKTGTEHKLNIFAREKLLALNKKRVQTVLKDPSSKYKQLPW